MRRLRMWRVRPAPGYRWRHGKRLRGWLLLVGGRRRAWSRLKKNVLRELVTNLARREPSDVLVRIHRKDGSLQETRIFPRDAVPKAWLS